MIATQLQQYLANHVLTFVTKGYFFKMGVWGGLNQTSRMYVHLLNRPSHLLKWAHTVKITAFRDVLNFKARRKTENFHWLVTVIER